MSSIEEEKKGLTRRDLLKGAAGATVIAGGSMLVGCSPQVEGSTESAAEPAAAEAASGDAVCAEGTTWRTPPPTIEESQIKETIDADVVVVGAGISGSCAALAAVEAGVSVAVLQKHSTAFANGAGIAAYNSKMQQENGIDFDVHQAVFEWMDLNENRSNYKLVKKWIEHSGETVDWIYDVTKDDESAGPILAPPNAGCTYEDKWTEAYPTAHLWLGASGMMQVAIDVTEKAASLGADVHYSTPAVQLIREEGGRVIGVIGQNEEGEYIQFNASKGVILAAGDYGHDPELRKEYMPFIEGLESAYPMKINTGDGHKMGVWAGAAMQSSPHCGNIHYDPPVEPIKDVVGSGMPWLMVNLNGERYSNEDVAYGRLYAQDMMQPEYTHFQIFDAKFEEDIPHMGQGMMRTEPAAMTKEGIDEAVDAGYVPSADTLEELAEKMGVPVDAFVATVERYNELYELGEDLDFGKQPARLSSIVQAPFYAIKRRPALLCSLGGLVINENMQVLDEEAKVIPGLYAAGNNSGSFFGGLEHPMNIPGMSLGRACVTGRLAGIYAAEEA